MKKSIVYLSMFLFVLILSVGSSEAAPPLQLKISEVHADLDANLIDIIGENFGTMPVVVLDGFPLTVVLSTDTFIQALIPDDLEGTYRLIVVDGWYSNPPPVRTDTMGVTIGAVGPVGPPGPPGQDGADGQDGAPGPAGPTLGIYDSLGLSSSGPLAPGDAGGRNLYNLGNVGIGTNSPAGKLDVYGKIMEYGHELLPRGVIVMWSGTLASIPKGWALCDGGTYYDFDGTPVITPDLRDRFIYGVSAGENPGATGGLVTHSHSYSDLPRHKHSGTANTAGLHRHEYATTTRGTRARSGNDIEFMLAPPSLENTSSSGNHGHTLAINNAGQTSCSTDSVNSLPPYYKLAFIMKL